MPPDPPAAAPIWHYPALVACIGDARPCGLSEVRSVAERILREAFSNHAQAGRIASHSDRRAAVAAALAALEGASSRPLF